MNAIPLNDWPRFLMDWLEPEQHGSPSRTACRISGTIGRDHKACHFPIAESRDAFGTLLRVNPRCPGSLTKGVKEREWRVMWAQVLARAGYRPPALDPVSYEQICKLLGTAERLEFILDTSSIISGAGHWLVSMFGTRCDLVRTVITDKEIQSFYDRWMRKDLAHKDVLKRRANYLAAARFLDQLAASRPLWRSLDVDDGALLLASGSSNDGAKSPAADTLLLRAAKRSIQEAVPGLRRYFVTDDVALARAATHILPFGSTICTWTEPLSDDGEVVSPFTWWPGSTELGTGHLSNIGEFVRQALTICESVSIERADAVLTAAEYQPDHNQYPSLWRAPVIWASEGPIDSTPPAIASVPSPDRPEEPRSSGPALSVAVERSEMRRPGTWPLRNISITKPCPTGARLAAGKVVGGLHGLLFLWRKNTSLEGNISLKGHSFDPKPKTDKELWKLFAALDLVSTDRLFLPAIRELDEAAQYADLDAVTETLAKAEPLYDLLAELRTAGMFDVSAGSFAGMSGWKLTAFLGLARISGQAVVSRADSAGLRKGFAYFGGASPDETTFAEWLDAAVSRIAAEEPLGEAPIAAVAVRALAELQLSPVRFERALRATLDGRFGARFEGASGGAVDATYLSEEVIRFEDDNLVLRVMSADGAAGLRALSRKRP